MSELEERYAVELVGAHPAGHDLEHARHDAKVDAAIAARVDQLEDLVLGQLGLGDENQVDLFFVDDLAQRGAVAEDPRPADGLTLLETVAHQPNDLVAVVGEHPDALQDEVGRDS